MRAVRLTLLIGGSLVVVAAVAVAFGVAKTHSVQASCAGGMVFSSSDSSRPAPTRAFDIALRAQETFDIARPEGLHEIMLRSEGARFARLAPDGSLMRTGPDLWTDGFTSGGCGLARTERFVADGEGVLHVSVWEGL